MQKHLPRPQNYSLSSWVMGKSTSVSRLRAHYLRRPSLLLVKARGNLTWVRTTRVAPSHLPDRRSDETESVFQLKKLLQRLLPFFVEQMMLQLPSPSSDIPDTSSLFGLDFVKMRFFSTLKALHLALGYSCQKLSVEMIRVSRKLLSATSRLNESYAVLGESVCCCPTRLQFIAHYFCFELAF